MAVTCEVRARVSGRKSSPLDAQAERLVDECVDKGYQLERIVKEIGSEGCDRWPIFLTLLTDLLVQVRIVEHDDGATRLGCRSIAVA